MAVLIRVATVADADAIASIYRHYVEHTRISFEEVAPDGAEIAERMRSPLHPWLVVEAQSRLVGYASTSRMRGRSAYRWSVETGLYLEAAAQGRGLGRKLLSAHLELLERQGFVTAIAGISLPNEASVALHEKLGFELTGVERGVGYKLGQWVDVGRWQKDLAPRLSRPSDPVPFECVNPAGGACAAGG